MMIENKEKHLIGGAAVSTTSFNQKSNSLFHIEENPSL